VPPPHIFEQSLQLPKALTLQSTGHGPVPQARVSVKSVHGLPPFEAGVVMGRVRV
jgi:hypothetical protein